MVHQEETILKWFTSFPAHARIRLICQMLLQSNELEQNFFLKVLQDMCKPGDQHTEQFNKFAFESVNDIDLSDELSRTKLMITIASMEPSDRQKATDIQRRLHASFALIYSHCCDSKTSIDYVEQMLLLYSLASYHPANDFQNQVFLHSYLGRLNHIYQQDGVSGQKVDEIESITDIAITNDEIMVTDGHYVFQLKISVKYDGNLEKSITVSKRLVDFVPFVTKMSSLFPNFPQLSLVYFESDAPNHTLHLLQGFIRSFLCMPSNVRNCPLSLEFFTHSAAPDIMANPGPKPAARKSNIPLQSCSVDSQASTHGISDSQSSNHDGQVSYLGNESDLSGMADNESGLFERQKRRKRSFSSVSQVDSCSISSISSLYRTLVPAALGGRKRNSLSEGSCVLVNQPTGQVVTEKSISSISPISNAKSPNGSSSVTAPHPVICRSLSNGTFSRETCNDEVFIYPEMTQNRSEDSDDKSFSVSRKKYSHNVLNKEARGLTSCYQGNGIVIESRDLPSSSGTDDESMLGNRSSLQYKMHEGNAIRMGKKRNDFGPSDGSSHRDTPSDNSSNSSSGSHTAPPVGPRTKCEKPNFAIGIDSIRSTNNVTATDIAAASQFTFMGDSSSAIKAASHGSTRSSSRASSLDRRTPEFQIGRFSIKAKTSVDNNCSRSKSPRKQEHRNKIKGQSLSDSSVTGPNDCKRQWSSVVKSSEISSDSNCPDQSDKTVTSSHELNSGQIDNELLRTSSSGGSTATLVRDDCTSSDDLTLPAAVRNESIINLSDWLKHYRLQRCFEKLARFNNLPDFLALDESTLSLLGLPGDCIKKLTELLTDLNEARRKQSGKENIPIESVWEIVGFGYRLPLDAPGPIRKTPVNDCSSSDNVVPVKVDQIEPPHPAMMPVNTHQLMYYPSCPPYNYWPILTPVPPQDNSKPLNALMRHGPILPPTLGSDMGQTGSLIPACIISSSQRTCECCTNHRIGDNNSMPSGKVSMVHSVVADGGMGTIAYSTESGPAATLAATVPNSAIANQSVINSSVNSCPHDTPAVIPVNYGPYLYPNQQLSYNGPNPSFRAIPYGPGANHGFPIRSIPDASGDCHRYNVEPNKNHVMTTSMVDQNTVAAHINHDSAVVTASAGPLSTSQPLSRPSSKDSNSVNIDGSQGSQAGPGYRQHRQTHSYPRVLTNNNYSNYDRNNQQHMHGSSYGGANGGVFSRYTSKECYVCSERGHVMAHCPSNPNRKKMRNGNNYGANSYHVSHGPAAAPKSSNKPAKPIDNLSSA